MAFIVTDSCIECKHTDCVEVCPVDCFYEGENFLVISPDECIDCGLCEPECPVDAIFSEDELPADQIKFIEINEQLSKEWPNITMVIFRNYQWGAEKRNSILWYDNNFVGTELDPELSYAKIAEACGSKGVLVKTQNELTEAIRVSCQEQQKGITTFIEVILNQELGEPFRRDAMKAPVEVAGINSADMQN